MGEWRPCTVTCGGGVEQRSVYCVRVLLDNGTFTDPLSDHLCSGSGTKPPSSRPCSEQPCPQWFTGAWSPVRLWLIHCRFYPRDAMLARVSAVVVCPSVRPSHVGIVAKQLKVESRKQRHTIVQGLHSGFLTPKVLAKFSRGRPQQKRQMRHRVYC